MMNTRTNTFRLPVLLFLFVSVAFGAFQEDTVGLRLLVVESMARAEEIRARVGTGPSFDALVRQSSIDPSSRVGGYLGAFREADLRAEFRDAVRGLGPGEISAVFPLDDRFAVLQVTSAADQAWIEARNAGLEDARAGRYTPAAERFSLALDWAERFPSNDQRLALSLNDLAEIRRIQGDPRAAIPFYSRALAIWEDVLGPADAELATPLNNLGEAHRAIGNTDQSIPLFRRAIAIWERDLGREHPRVATGANNLALALNARGEADEAESLFRRALEIRERTEGAGSRGVAAVLHNLATLLVSRNRSAEAEPLAERSIDIMQRVLGPDHPDLVPNLENMARIQFQLGDYSEAVGLYERSMRLRWTVAGDPDSLRSLLDQLVEFVGLGLTRDPGSDTASDMLAETIRRVSTNAELDVAIGRLLLSAGLEEIGERILAQAVERFPESWLAREQFGVSEEDAGRFEAALEAFGQALALEPPDDARYRLWTRSGDIHRERDEPEPALAAYGAAQELGVGDSAAAMGEGILHAERNELDLARTAFERASRVAPASGEVHSRRAEIYMRSGQPDAALDAARMAVGLDPENRRAQYILGQSLLQVGQPDEAQQVLGEYARLEAAERAHSGRLFEAASLQSEAVQLFADGAADSAIELLKEGIRSFPEVGSLRVALGVIEIRQSEWTAARETLEALSDEGIGDDSLIQWYLSRAYAALGDGAGSQRHEALYLERIASELSAYAQP